MTCFFEIAFAPRRVYRGLKAHSPQEQKNLWEIEFLGLFFTGRIRPKSVFVRLFDVNFALSLHLSDVDCLTGFFFSLDKSKRYP